MCYTKQIAKLKPVFTGNNATWDYKAGFKEAKKAALDIADEADARIAELEAQLAAAQERERGHLELLRRLEWLEGEYGPRVCHLCYEQERQGHTAECEIAAALAAQQEGK